MMNAGAGAGAGKEKIKQKENGVGEDDRANRPTLVTSQEFWVSG
jgi:hypothetical protein